MIDEMLRRLGLAVTHELAPFEPEAGAYHGDGSHNYGHGHSHDHSHSY